MSKIHYELKKVLIDLAGNSFHYFKGFYDFFDSCEIPDVKERYSKDDFNKFEIMGNVLRDLENSGRIDIINNIKSSFYKMDKAVDHAYFKEVKNNKAKITKSLLKDLKNILQNDPIEDEIKKRKINENKKEHQDNIKFNKEKKNSLSELKDIFFKLHSQKDNFQQRGFDLEKVFFDLLDLEKIDNKRPYKIIGEQIDGHFKYESFDYIVEIKWTAEVVKYKDFSIFEGKIKNKLQSTRGLIFSINGFDGIGVQKTEGSKPNIILMDGGDFIHILEDRVSFSDLFANKVHHCATTGNILYKYTK